MGNYATILDLCGCRKHNRVEKKKRNELLYVNVVIRHTLNVSICNKPKMPNY